MDIEHLMTPATCHVWMRYAARQSAVIKRGFVQVISSDGENFLLSQAKIKASCQLCSGGDSELLRSLWQSNCHLLAYVESDTMANVEFRLQITPVDKVVTPQETLILTLSETAYKACKIYGGVPSVKELLTLQQETSRYVLIQPYSEEDTPEIQPDKPYTFHGLPRFSLICSLFTMKVCRKTEHGIEYYQALDLVPHVGRAVHGIIKMFPAELVFSKKEKALSYTMQRELDMLNIRQASYLDLWRKYRDASMNEVLKKGQEFALHVDNTTEDTQDNTVTLQVSGQWGTLEEGLEVCLVSQLPPYLMNPQTASPITAQLRDEMYQMSHRENIVCIGTVLSISRNAQQPREGSVVLQVDPYPPRGKPSALIPDIRADLLQLRRQRAAYDAIYKGYSANCFLSQIIEKQSTYYAKPRKNKILAESPFVREKLNRDLTPNQKEAVELALNTPDIVLIQGPPGTGKTTVITTILERLNELQDKSKPVQGEVLVTSFQHDAVQNIIERISINSLPAIKFGTKAGNNGDSHDEKQVDQLVWNWAQEVAEKLMNTYPSLKQELPMDKVLHLSQLYAAAPLPETARQLLVTIRHQPLPLSGALQGKIDDALRSLQRTRQPEDVQELLRLIYSLRTSEAGHRDDGQRIARQLEDKLTEEEGIEEDIMGILQEVQGCCSAPSTELLKKLGDAKQRLLKRFVPQAHFSLPEPRADILEIIDDFKFEYDTQKQASEISVDSIRRQFLDALRCNPQEIREAIENYNYVYSATNQQALGDSILRRKAAIARVRNFSQFKREAEKKCGIVPEMFYSTVVVDEAAKSAPPDLMVPMALARQRIILVGDHRQLPHMVDKAVCRKLEENNPDPDSATFSESLKESMFEYLKERLEDLQKRDGIKRTITLTAQFRTHPELGKMVSRYFYEPYGEGYSSPLSSSNFEHNLPGTNNKPCVWLEVPGSSSSISRDATGSCYNGSEACRVATQLKAWMDSPEGANLSFGVISFYNAQITEIRNQLIRIGMTDPKGSIYPQYSTLLTEDGKRIERLRIGTVDSFQGMEFDVVILSMVRTKAVCRGTFPFGFLECANRLCVALSRQKRLLAIAGDSSLADSGLCRSRKDSMAIMAEFLDKCKEYGTFISA